MQGRILRGHGHGRGARGGAGGANAPQPVAQAAQRQVPLDRPVGGDAPAQAGAAPQTLADPAFDEPFP
ncbi:hypothetical protein MRX96_006126 [Rhipicephalus microplus]